MVEIGLKFSVKLSFMNNHGKLEKISGMYVIDLRKKTINAYKESRKKFFIGIVGVV